MNLKCKTEIKDELLESTEDISHYFEQELRSEVVQEWMFYPLIDVKDEIKIEDEPFHINKDDVENEEPFDQISAIESQTFITDAEIEEKGTRYKLKSSLRSTQQKSRCQQRINKNIKEFSCEFCKFSFKTQDELKIHLRSHSKRKYICSHCDYECNHLGHLNQHMLKHTNIKMFKCNVCNFEFNRNANLKRHMLTHSNTKLFQCSKCSYGCNDKPSLTMHTLTHSTSRLFQCSECNFECNEKRSLRLHMFKLHEVNHEKLKLYQCADCNHECYSKLILKRHMLKHTNTKQFKCAECNFECNYKHHLKRHTLKKHN